MDRHKEVGGGGGWGVEERDQNAKKGTDRLTEKEDTGIRWRERSTAWIVST